MANTIVKPRVPNCKQNLRSHLYLRLSAFPKALTLISAINFSVFILPVNLNAQIYSWQDDKGRTHFGDTVPQQYKATANRVQAKTANVIGNDYSKTLEELRSAGIEITPELRQQAEQESARRQALAEQQVEENQEKAQQQAKQAAAKRTRELEKQKQLEEQRRLDRAIYDTCGRRSHTSSERDLCVHNIKRDQARCLKPRQTQRDKDWCKRNYRPEQYH